MKVQLFGLSGDWCKKEICFATRNTDSPSQLPWAIGWDAYRDFESKRLNGDYKSDGDEGRKPIMLAYDGRIIWVKGHVEKRRGEHWKRWWNEDEEWLVCGVEESDGQYHYECRYDPGPKDLECAKKSDSYYLHKIFREGKLQKLEPDVWRLREIDRAQNVDIGDWWSQKLKLFNIGELLANSAKEYQKFEREEKQLSKRKLFSEELNNRIKHLTQQIQTNSIFRIDLSDLEIPGNFSNTIEGGYIKLRPIIASDLIDLLDALAVNNSVVELDLAGNLAINDDIIKPLIAIYVPGFFSSFLRNSNTTLKVIDLCGTSVTQKGLIELREAIKERQLTLKTIDYFSGRYGGSDGDYSNLPEFRQQKSTVTIVCGCSYTYYLRKQREKREQESLLRERKSQTPQATTPLITPQKEPWFPTLPTGPDEREKRDKALLIKAPEETSSRAAARVAEVERHSGASLYGNVYGFNSSLESPIQPSQAMGSKAREPSTPVSPAAGSSASATSRAASQEEAEKAKLEKEQKESALREAKKLTMPKPVIITDSEPHQVGAVSQELSETHLAMLKEMQHFFPRLQAVSQIDQKTLRELQGEALAFTGSMAKEKLAQLAEQEKTYILSHDRLGDYYYSFMAQFTSTFVACKSIHSGKAKDEEKITVDYVGQGIDALGRHIPGISVLTAILSNAISAYSGHNKKKAANNIATFFATIHEADVFIEQLARRLVFVVEAEINQLVTQQKVGVFRQAVQTVEAVKDWFTANDVDTEIKKLAGNHFKKILQAIIDGELTPYPKVEDLAVFIKIVVPSYQPQQSVFSPPSPVKVPPPFPITDSSSLSSPRNSAPQPVSLPPVLPDASAISKAEIAELLKKMQETQVALQEERAARLALEDKLKRAEQVAKEAREDATKAKDESRQAIRDSKDAKKAVEASGLSVGGLSQQLYLAASAKTNSKGKVVSVDELHVRVTQLEFWQRDVGPTLAQLPQAEMSGMTGNIGDPEARNKLLGIPIGNNK